MVHKVSTIVLTIFCVTQCFITLHFHFSILFEIAGKKPSIKYNKSDHNEVHYGNTPYRYTPKRARKIIPTEYVDFGQGLLDIIEEINQELDS